MNNKINFVVFSTKKTKKSLGSMNFSKLIFGVFFLGQNLAFSLEQAIVKYNLIYIYIYIGKTDKKSN